MSKVKLNVALLKQAIRVKQSNQRQATSHVKTRGEVSGGGKKPWRQKGTGRARAGSSRSPIWVGGGTVFGPSKIRHYKLSLPPKMAKAAFEQLLAYLNQEKRVIIVDSLALKEPKTKAAVALISSHTGSMQGLLLVTEKIEPELLTATANLRGVTVATNSNLSLLDLANAATVVMEKSVAEKRSLVKSSAPGTAPVKKKSATTKAKESK